MVAIAPAIVPAGGVAGALLRSDTNLLHGEPTHLIRGCLSNRGGGGGGGAAWGRRADGSGAVPLRLHRRAHDAGARWDGPGEVSAGCACARDAAALAEYTGAPSTTPGASISSGTILD